MLLLVNKYGLSHVCGNDEFKNQEQSTWGNNNNYFYPYLDILFEDKNVEKYLRKKLKRMEFLFRGYNEDDQMDFGNLFQYLLFAQSHGFQGNLLFCFGKLFGLAQEDIYEDFILLKDLVKTNETYIDRKELLVNSNGKRIS